MNKYTNKNTLTTSKTIIINKNLVQRQTQQIWADSPQESVRQI